MRSRRRDSGDPDLELRSVEGERLTLAFLPSVGGRLLSLEVDGHELLWRNPAFFDAELRAVRPRASWRTVDGTFASWSNVGGSKSWPAPQGWSGSDEWPGPPDAVLDAGPWSWAESERDDGGLDLAMVSEADARTGLRMERRFSIPATGTRFDETLVLENIFGRPVTWAAWEVCQVDTSAGVGDPSAAVVVDVAGSAEPLLQGDYAGDLSWRRVRSAIELPVQEVVAKRGFRDAVGISWRGPRGEGLTLGFEPQPQASYPDGGARAEVWMQAPVDAAIPSLSGLHPDAYLAELEVLGPLTTLPPGERSELAIRWTATAPRRGGYQPLSRLR